MDIDFWSMIRCKLLPKFFALDLHCRFRAVCIRVKRSWTSLAHKEMFWKIYVSRRILNYFQRFTVFTGHSLAYTVYSSISFRSAIRLSWMIFALFAIASGGLAFYMCFGKDSPTLRFDRDSCRLPFVPFTCFLCMSHSCTTLHSNKVWSFSSAAHYSSLTAQT